MIYSKNFCGGYIDNHGSSNDCYKMNQNESLPFVKMNHRRQDASSVVYNNSLWITGGIDKFYGSLKSTEYIFLTGESVPGPDLPHNLWLHAMVNIRT